MGTSVSVEDAGSRESVPAVTEVAAGIRMNVVWGGSGGDEGNARQA